MPKLSACIELIFRELPPAERVDRVAELGLDGFEFWRVKGKDLKALKAVQDEVGIACASLLGTGEAALVNSAKRSDALGDLEKNINVAVELSCPTLIVQVGDALADVSRAKQHQSIVEGLGEASPVAEEAGVTLVVEPLNVLVDHQGYYLSSSAEGFEIIEEVDSPSVKLLYDVYHQQITEGNLITTITEHIDDIGHVHVADVPGRHEPGTGEINYANIFAVLDELHYDGYVGLEYRPLEDSESSLRRVLSLIDVQRTL